MSVMLKIAGEIGTKSSRTRRRFLRVLVRNVRRALDRAGVSGVVEPRWTRVFVHTDEPGAARAALARVFGVHSVSEAALIPFSGLDDLVAGAARLFRDRVAGRKFGVRVKRSGRHPFGSIDVAVAFRAVDLAEWRPAAPPRHVVEEVPEGAVVVDVRERDEGPTAGDLRRPFSRVAEWARRLDRGADYVFVCSHGVRSEIVARELAERGYRARSLAGGIARLGTHAA